MGVDGIHRTARRGAAVTGVELLENAEQMFVRLLQGAESPGSGLPLAPVERPPTRFRRADQQMHCAVFGVVNEADRFGAGDGLLSGLRLHRLSAIHGGIAVLRKEK